MQQVFQVTRIEVRASIHQGLHPLSAQYPEIVTLVTEFSQMHCFATESCHRQMVGNAVGVMLNEVNAHAVSFPKLEKKSTTHLTIHQLLVGPRRNTWDPTQYHALIDAKVLHKDNFVYQSHQNGHCAFVYIGELLVQVNHRLHGQFIF